MNILLILNDALRPDHLGCYGYHKDTSPTIDSIAGEGVLFENVISTASHTVPPIVSIITGQTTATHGIVNADRYAQWLKSPAWRGRKTPLTVLEQEGYLIDGELVVRWKPLGFKRDTKTEEFGSYFEKNRDQKWFFMAEPYPTHLPYNPPEKYFAMFLDKEYSINELTQRNLAVVRSNLIVHPPGVVSKLEAGENEPLPDDQADDAHKRTVGIVDLKQEDRPAIIACYDGEVRVFDDMVLKWIDTLRELRVLEKTLIIITSDHGEELMERGYVGHSSCNLRGTLYDESIKVPLIMRYPAKLPRAQVVKKQISHIDIMPTIFQLLDLPGSDTMEGNSVVPLIENDAYHFREESFAETTPAGWQSLQNDDREIWCVRTIKWKLILNTTRSGMYKRYELYDLVLDPGETRNLYSTERNMAKALQEKLEAYVRKARTIKL
jgi:arylsulfatase A-like enzyme